MPTCCPTSASPRPTATAATRRSAAHDGPLQVEDYRTILPLTHRFIEAAQQAGHPFRTDLNGAEQEGVGYSQMTRVGRWRGSTARTYLRAAGDRVRVETEAQVSRLLFDGRRCIGAEYRQGGALHRITATREVILSGGAVNSPHVLQMSGIGPADHLRALGIEVLADMPAVGANLQDHYVSRVQHRVKDGLSTNQLARGVAAGRRGRALRPARQWRADLRRHHRAGLRALARGPRQPRPAIAVHAGLLRARPASACWRRSPA